MKAHRDILVMYCDSLAGLSIGCCVKSSFQGGAGFARYSANISASYPARIFVRARDFKRT